MTDYTNDPRWGVLDELLSAWQDPQSILAALDAVDPARVWRGVSEAKWTDPRVEVAKEWIGSVHSAPLPAADFLAALDAVDPARVWRSISEPPNDV